MLKTKKGRELPRRWLAAWPALAQEVDAGCGADALGQKTHILEAWWTGWTGVKTATTPKASVGRDADICLQRYNGSPFPTLSLRGLLHSGARETLRRHSLTCTRQATALPSVTLVKL